MSPRFEDFRPYELPDSLDNLKGPADGSITLPVTIYWAPGDGTIPLDTLGHIKTAYQAVISEGTAQDQCTYLNKDILINIWPHLQLPTKATRQWEEAFEELKGKKGA